MSLYFYSFQISALVFHDVGRELEILSPNFQMKSETQVY